MSAGLLNTRLALSRPQKCLAMASGWFTTPNRKVQVTSKLAEANQWSAYISPLKFGQATTIHYHSYSQHFNTTAILDLC